MIKHLVRTGLLGILVSTLAVSSASGQVDQSAIDAIMRLKQQQYNNAKAMQDKQLEIDRMRADTDRIRAEAEISRSNAQISSGGGGGGNTFASSARSFIPVDRDSLASVHPPTYKLGNGLVLQMTGIFWPDAFTVCVANCR